jgi:hypothetical protein
MPALRSQTTSRLSRKPHVKLVPATADDYRFSDKYPKSDFSYDDTQPKDIEEPWPYLFRVRISPQLEGVTKPAPTEAWR